MFKCTICGKEFSDKTSDMEFTLHVMKEHKNELEETAKNVSKTIKSNKKLLQKKK